MPAGLGLIDFPSTWSDSFSLYDQGYAVIPNLEIDAAWFHAFYDSITTAGTEIFQGAYGTRANIWALSVVWKMPR